MFAIRDLHPRNNSNNPDRHTHTCLDEAKVPFPRRRVDVRARSPPRPPRPFRESENRFRIAATTTTATTATATAAFCRARLVPATALLD